MATPPMLELPERADPAGGGYPRPDPVAALVVMLFGLSALGLALGGVLAVYDWRTPAALRPLMWSLLGVFFAGVAMIVIGSLTRWLRTGRPR